MMYKLKNEQKTKINIDPNNSPVAIREKRK